ncbi:2-thiouracil desulfurase family protein, partial [Kitasatospora sp. NPDC091257]|uniref:2-thiouracil desulfurase family protein n=1 Tax=Kitasatospora sp. NPDC091257 TaxID=3364084 RepID=UPI00382C73B2
MVSACLAGIPCRYDGRAKTSDDAVRLVERGRAVVVCPEGKPSSPWTTCSPGSARTP